MENTVVKSILKKIIGQIEASDFRGALSTFRDLFLDPSITIPDDYIEEIINLFFKTIEQITLVQKIIFVKSVAKSKNIPVTLCRRLLQEAPMISGPLMEHTWISEPELVKIIEGGDKQRLMSIAKRDCISETVSDLIVARGSLDVLEAIARNGNARLSRQSLEQLVATAAVEPQIDNALSERSDLPPELARHLSKALTAENRIKLADMIDNQKLRTRRPLALRN